MRAVQRITALIEEGNADSTSVVQYIQPYVTLMLLESSRVYTHYNSVPHLYHFHVQAKLRLILHSHRILVLLFFSILNTLNTYAYTHVCIMHTSA